MTITRTVRTRGTPPSSRLAVWLFAASLMWTAQAGVAQVFILSPDVTIELDGLVVDDEDAVLDQLVSVDPFDLGPVPASVDVIAYTTDGGDAFFVPDSIVELPGGEVISRRDIVLWDGGSYEIVFKGAGEGVPAYAAIDALSLTNDGFVMSFDTTVELAGVAWADEDLVLWDGSFNGFYDGSTDGLDAGLDLDAVHVLPGDDLALSFDGSGTVDGVVFDDEDVLLRDTAGNWQMLYDGSSVDTGWRGADLDALYVELAHSGPLFTDGFESGTTSAWDVTVP